MGKYTGIGIFFLCLCLPSGAQEYEVPLTCNPVLEEAYSHCAGRKGLKDAPAYPLRIAGKNYVQQDSLVWDDTLVVNDTLSFSPSFFLTDTLVSRMHKAANGTVIQYVYKRLDTNKIQRTINIYIPVVTYRLENFPGTEIHLIDTFTNVSASYSKQHGEGDFFVSDTLTVQKDSVAFSHSIIRRHSTVLIDKVVISDSTSFFDDFSFSSVYPNPYLWKSRSTYINNNYGRDPISLGVATFDALDEKGYLYTHEGLSFSADTLLSSAIRFDSKSNVYLSFYYQPAGYGEDPDKNDTLRLEFYSPVTNTFHVVWSATDTWENATSDSPNVTPFKAVIIPITDTAYLQDGFRFRFINVVSYETSLYTKGGKGNCDVWNIDYVYLAANRTADDTNFYDLAIVYPAQFRLTRYESMPYSHFKNPQVQRTEFLWQMRMAIRNNNKTDGFSVFYKYYTDGNFKLFKLPYFTNILPGQLLYLDDAPCDTMDVRLTDTTSFVIKTVLDKQDENEFATVNDTAYFRQYFKNYYAYDDGSAEMGYSLSGTGTEGAMVAYQFITRIPDTLWGVSIFFNRLIQPTTETYYFNLMVWNNKNGKPGEVLFETSDEYSTIPVFQEGFNKFYNYQLHTLHPLVVKDTFYIGFRQVLSKPMSVGLDKNRINTNKIFYNIDGFTWVSSRIKGSLMMRPIMGKYDPSDFSQKQVQREIITVYPNPVGDYLYFHLPSAYQALPLRYVLYDIHGRSMATGQVTAEPVTVSSLANGIYILIITHEGERVSIQKISVMHE